MKMSIYPKIAGKIKINKDSLNLILLILKRKIMKIILLIYRYLINIMKKVEFELFRNEGVYIKLTREQKELIGKLAKCQKKNNSEFIKWLIFSKYIDDFIK